MSQALPNMGVDPGMVEPVNNDHIYKDSDKPLEVSLVVFPSTNPGAVPTDNHWMLSWVVGTNSIGEPVHRKLHIVREIGCDHLTNWGPFTAAAQGEYITLPIKDMTLAERKEMEKLAATTEVMKPDGWWNCQDWIASLLDQSTAKNLVTPEVVSNVLNRARQVLPAN